MDQLEYDSYHCVSWGFMDGWRCHVRVVLFFVDHVVPPSILSWAVFGDKRSGDMVLFFCFFYVFLLAKQERWAVSIRTCEGNDIFCAHTPPAAHRDEIGPHFFFLPPISLPLSVFLSSNHSVAPISTMQATFPFSPLSYHGYTYIPAPSPPPHQHTPRGVIVTQWEGSITTALLLSATTPPVLFLLPLQSHLSVQLVQ